MYFTVRLIVSMCIYFATFTIPMRWASLEPATSRPRGRHATPWATETVQIEMFCLNRKELHVYNVLIYLNMVGSDNIIDY